DAAYERRATLRGADRRGPVAARVVPDRVSGGCARRTGARGHAAPAVAQAVYAAATVRADRGGPGRLSGRATRRAGSVENGAGRERGSGLPAFPGPEPAHRRLDGPGGR